MLLDNKLKILKIIILILNNNYTILRKQKHSTNLIQINPKYLIPIYLDNRLKKLKIITTMFKINQINKFVLA